MKRGKDCYFNNCRSFGSLPPPLLSSTKTDYCGGGFSRFWLFARHVRDGGHCPKGRQTGCVKGSKEVWAKKEV